ncbi:MAG TPA: AraC family transcriptional regulator [Pyrinomonadaceae bacterium]|nr:AraC family transcriptional regulator [Pyrinomonadaceae bacterium]
MQAKSVLSNSRDDTVAAHRQAVERVILTMRERLDEPMSLQDMGDIAFLSPFHFNRVFHQMTGLPPAQFLYALRLEAAKRLLLTTSLSVTEVCYEVGYNSVGTFTYRFTQLVGLSPRHFRFLAQKIDDSLLESLFVEGAAIFKNASLSPCVAGRVIAPKPAAGLIFIGLFPTFIPQSRPVGGTLLTWPGSYSIGPVIDGRYYVFAAAFPPAKDLLAYLLPDAASLLVGVGKRPAVVRKELPGEPVDVILRPVQITDPPILIALPLLLAEAFVGDGGY